VPPTAMGTASAMRRILSGFIGSVSAGRPANPIGQTASSGGHPGEDSQPGPSPIPSAAGVPQHADEHRSKGPVLLAVDHSSAKVRLSG
jgi:hypothetical protein